MGRLEGLAATGLAISVFLLLSGAWVATLTRGL